MSSWQPREGDECVDLRLSRVSYRPDACGEVVTVKTLTPTMVITSDGERYNRDRLHPVSEGRYSDRLLVPADDDRVLCVHGAQALRQVAQLVGNLAAIQRSDPADFAGAFAQIMTAAGDARRDHTARLTRATQKGTRP